MMLIFHGKIKRDHRVSWVWVIIRKLLIFLSVNVLLTAVGRRSYLVDYFRNALQGRGEVIATNTHAHVPGMYAADEAIVVPPSNSEGYVDVILSICERYNVGLLCSLHDVDTAALSKSREAFTSIGVSAAIPDSCWGERCLDKWASTRYLGKHGFAVPWTNISLEAAQIALDSGEICFPLIVKPRYGFGSIDVYSCSNQEELREYHQQVYTKLSSNPLTKILGSTEHPVLIQEKVRGIEYCLNIVNDFTGEYACHFVGEVHSMRSGESDSLIVAEPSIVGDLAHRLSRLSRHSGIWGVDMICKDGRFYVIDINPRFTGDYPFQQLAGANIPAVLTAWAEGFKAQEDWFIAEPGIRGYKDITIRQYMPHLASHALKSSAWSRG